MQSAESTPLDVATPVRRPGPPDPAPEGTNGLFTQSWFPICQSDEVPAGAIVGKPFLDGRVVVCRDADGRAKVLSAFCPHMGASLEVGEMVEGTLRCAFHHWRFSPKGECVATGCEDRAPAAARLFSYPTAEKFGLIWAFNGLEPTFELPSLSRPDSRLVYRLEKFDGTLPVDPWVICCNTPDIQHIKVLHGISFDGGDPHDRVEWTDHSMFYNMTGKHRGDVAIDFRVGILGSSIYFQEGTFNGQWFGFIAPFGLPRPGTTEAYLIIAVEGDPAQPEAVAPLIDQMMALEKHVTFEDMPVLNTARFRPGTLTRTDRTLARFLRYMADYPRAHPGADFIK